MRRHSRDPAGAGAHFAHPTPPSQIAFSDEGDDENDLFSQLQLVYDLLTMFFGTITKFSYRTSTLPTHTTLAAALSQTLACLCSCTQAHTSKQADKA